MRPFRALVLAVAAAGAGAAAVAASPAEATPCPAPAPADRDVRREVQRALTLRDPVERTNAVEEALRGADDAGAADAVLALLFVPDSSQALLGVGVRALARMTSAGAQDAVTKALDDPRRLRKALVAEALGRASGAASRVQLETLTRAADVRLRAAAVAALGERREPESFLAFATALEDPEWTVRSAAVSALRSLGDVRAVPLLADRMRREDGRLLDDLADACAFLTGKRFGPDPAAYERVAGGTAGPATDERPVTCATPLFETRARSILFVLCTSETMKDPVNGAAADAFVAREIAKAGDDLGAELAAAKTKMELARTHLRAMIRGVADGVAFDVMTYANSPTFAFGDLTRADDASRRKAEARIARISPGGMPDVHEAVHRIFDPRAKDPFEAPDGPDLVVVISDGALPSNGFRDRNEIAPRATRWNRARQIRFVTVAVGQSDPYLLGALAGGPPAGLSLAVP